MTHTKGDRVEYVGDGVAESKGERGTIEGPGTAEGRYSVTFDFGPKLDMCGTVLRSVDSEGVKSMATSKGRKTVVRHPDGTVSTRNSKSAIYTYAVETIQDNRSWAAGQRAEATKLRAERERFIAAVRGGRVSREPENKLGLTHFHLNGEDGERWWLGSEDHETGSKLDRKESVRKTLKLLAEGAESYDRKAAEADAGPEYSYGVARWSGSHENATKALAEFAGWAHTTVRVVPADAAE